MALSTTQSIWRSGGGDQTRTAYCGSGLMAATFYIADVAAASSTNVAVSSTSGAPALILPAGARIMSITFTGDAATGQTDMGFTLYTLVLTLARVCWITPATSLARLPPVQLVRALRLA